MNENELRRRFPRASRAFVAANTQISHTLPKLDKKSTLGRATNGKKGGLERIIVRFKGRRVRPLDPDNFAGSIKDLLDGLRYAHLLPDDTIWDIKLETSQEKIAVYSEETTTIEISYP